jgi:arginase family enzyme
VLQSSFICEHGSYGFSDNAYAIDQIEKGHKSLLHRTPFSALGNDSETGKPLVPLAKDGKHHPRVITLGGDHTIVLPLLRSIHSAYGEISVIHFDRFVQGFATSSLSLNEHAQSSGHLEAFRVRRCTDGPGCDQPRHLLLLGE